MPLGGTLLSCWSLKCLSGCRVGYPWLCAWLPSLGLAFLVCWCVLSCACLAVLSYPALFLLLAVGPLTSVQAPGLGQQLFAACGFQCLGFGTMMGWLRATCGLVFYSTPLYWSPGHSTVLHSTYYTLVYTLLSTLLSSALYTTFLHTSFLHTPCYSSACCG